MNGNVAILQVGDLMSVPGAVGRMPGATNQTTDRTGSPRMKKGTARPYNVTKRRTCASRSKSEMKSA